MFLHPVPRTGHARIRREMSAYLEELRSYGSGSRPAHYLDSYLRGQGGRQASFIHYGNQIVGFAFLRILTGEDIRELSEFWIQPAFRRRGLGRTAATNLLLSHPGSWRLLVTLRNEKAHRFWTSTICSIGAVHIRADDGAGQRILTFTVHRSVQIERHSACCRRKMSNS